MPLRAGQIGGSRRLAGFAIPSNPANLQSIRFNFTTNQWEFVTVTGELNTMTNVGAGPGFIFRNKIGVNFNIKSLINGTNMTILNNVDDITISTLAEINLAANVGAGTALIFRDKTGVTLNLKSLIAGTGITLINGADDITITSSVVAALGDLELLRDKQLAGDLIISTGRVSGAAPVTVTSITPAAGKTFFIAKSQHTHTNRSTVTVGRSELQNNGVIKDIKSESLDPTNSITFEGTTVGDSLVGDGVITYRIQKITGPSTLDIAGTLLGWIQDT